MDGDFLRQPTGILKVIGGDSYAYGREM